MSVANIMLEANRVRLQCDTVAYRDKSPAQLHRKITIVESAHLALSVRGLVTFGNIIRERAPFWSCFTEAIEDISHAVGHLPRNVAPEGAEIALVGWEQGAPRAARLTVLSVKTLSVARVDLLPGSHLAPTIGAHSIPPGMSNAQLHQMAVLQQDLCLKHGLNMCVGGDVEVAEVTAAGISIMALGEYPNKAETVAAIERRALAA